MKNILLTLAVSFGLFGLSLGVVNNGAAVASTKGELCSGANLDISGGSGAGCGDSSACSDDDKNNDEGCDSEKLNKLINTVVNVFSVIVGVAAVIMIIYGGFRYITSGGDSGNITTAKNTILYALVGLVIVALAQGIVRFVLSNLK